MRQVPTINALMMTQRLNLKGLKYFYINQKGFFQFDIINVRVSYFRFIGIPMLWVYGHDKYFTLSVRRSTVDVGI